MDAERLLGALRGIEGPVRQLGIVQLAIQTLSMQLEATSPRTAKQHDVLHVTWPDGAEERIPITDPNLPVRIGRGSGSLTVQMARGDDPPLQVVIAGGKLPMLMVVQAKKAQA